MSTCCNSGVAMDRDMTASQPFKQNDLDYMARELYDYCRRHVAPCLGYISLYDELIGRCPHCGSLIVAGPRVTPERAREMLAVLRARRRELGLTP
jgi:DNA-directed RNA polymerase subunit RPC12/RpoP